MINTIMNEATARHEIKKTQARTFVVIVAACLVLAIVIIIHLVTVHHLRIQLADAQKQLADSKSAGAQAQSDLDKAKSQAADLQTQLEKTKAQLSDTKSLLDQSKQATAAVQAQLDKSKAQAADLQARLDKSTTQVADLQNQLNQSSAGSAQLLTQLDQAKIQTMDLQARLQKAEGDLSQLQPLLLKARHMPVTTSLEKGHGGRSFTLHINNLYMQPLSVDIAITGPDKTRTQSNVIGAGGTLLVDKLAAGESVVVASDGYDPVNLTVQ